MNSDPPAGVVLAAGKGTRMASELPKVLHKLGELPLVAYPIAAAKKAGVERIVVVIGYRAEEVQAAVEALAKRPASTSFALQAQQNGTGHAVLMALPALAEHHGPVLILSGDVPLIRAQTLKQLVASCRAATSGLAMASFQPQDPAQYGRIVRTPEGVVSGIVEFRDATPQQRQIAECNAGVYCVDAQLLRDHLPNLGSDNAQGEIYLTDLVAIAARRGEVETLDVDPIEVAGVNTKQQLAQLARRL